MSEQKIVAGLSRLAANYLRDPIGVRQPPLNGVEVVEARDSISVAISTAFADPIDLAIAQEIIANGLIDAREYLSANVKQTASSLEISFVFERSLMMGASQEVVTGIASALSSFKERLKSEVLSSKVRNSAEIRTAIAHASQVFASHRASVKRGA